MNSFGGDRLTSIIMEEQAPDQVLFLNDSPSSFVVLFFAMHGDAGVNFEQFPFAIIISFVFDLLMLSSGSWCSPQVILRSQRSSNLLPT